jgi:hypothetical protein
MGVPRCGGYAALKQSQFSIAHREKFLQLRSGEPVRRREFKVKEIYFLASF